MHKTRVLGTFSLAMITMAAIVSLRNLSFIAALGISAVFFLCLAIIIFFIPTALVIAELAAAWPRAGGCYVWVSEAYGKPLGFLTLWLAWMASVTWFPTILAFFATMLGHMLEPLIPHLHLNQSYIMACILIVFWGATFINFIGIEFSGWITSAGVIVGTIIPGAIIILLGLWWMGTGNISYIPLSFNDLVPAFSMDNLIIFSGVLLSLAGVELAAYHVREAQDPQHKYPRAVLISSASLLAIYILGTLAIAVVVPAKDLSLASGMMQAFNVFFAHMNLAALLPLLAGCLLLGALASVNAWVAGPAKGMLAVAEDGFFPKWLRRVNKQGVPTSLLLLQAVIGSALCILFIYAGMNTSIWILTALSAQFTCLEYILIFLAALRLRATQPKVARPFKVQGMWPLAVSGIIACIFGYLIVYVPHSQFIDIGKNLYNCLLVGSFVLLLIPPLLLIKYRRRSTRTAK